jgi:hypothetical protein
MKTQNTQDVLNRQHYQNTTTLHCTTPSKQKDEKYLISRKVHSTEHDIYIHTAFLNKQHPRMTYVALNLL